MQYREYNVWEQKAWTVEGKYMQYREYNIWEQKAWTVECARISWHNVPSRTTT